MSGSSGNTRDFELNTGWRARKETERHRHRLDASYLYGEAENVRTKTAATAGALNDWLVPDATWFAFAKLRYDFDDFKAWTHRANSHAGLGEQLLKTENAEILGRLGLGASKQWEPTDDLQPEGLLGLDGEWSINEQQSFIASSYLYPYLDDWPEYRLISNAEYNIQLDQARGINMHAGIEHEYESSVGTETRNWDLRYYAGISISF